MNQIKFANGCFYWVIRKKKLFVFFLRLKKWTNSKTVFKNSKLCSCSSQICFYTLFCHIECFSITSLQPICHDIFDQDSNCHYNIVHSVFVLFFSKPQIYIFFCRGEHYYIVILKDELWRLTVYFDRMVQNILSQMAKLELRSELWEGPLSYKVLGEHSKQRY